MMIEREICGQRVVLVIDSHGLFSARWSAGPPQHLTAQELDAYMQARAELLNLAATELRDVPPLHALTHARWL
jgi:hypothetical protein